MADPATRRISARAVAEHAVRAAQAHQTAKAARDAAAKARHAELVAERAAAHQGTADGPA